MNAVYVFLIISIIVLVIQNTSCAKKGEISSINVFSKQNFLWCKSFAALFIMYGHTVAALKNTDNFPAILGKIDFGWHWVALFFLCSGYGVTFGVNNKKDYMKGFLKNRLVKVLIPFVSAHIFYFAVKSLTGTVFTIRDLVLGLLGQLNVVEYSWYPIALAVMYIIFVLVWKLKLSDKYKLIILSAANILYSFIALAIFGHNDWWYISNLAFAVGCTLYYLPSQYKEKPVVLICSSVITFLFGILIQPFYSRIIGGYSAVAYVVSCNIATAGMACAFIGAMTAFSNIHSNLIKHLSNISYEVYLLHGLIIYSLKLFGIERYPWFFLLVTILGTVLLAVPVHFINQKIVGLLIIDYRRVKN